MGNISWDIRFAFRQMRRAPLLSLVVIFSLGLAIGCATGLFSMISAAFFQPLPVREPDRLMSLYTTVRSDSRLLPVAFPDYEDLVRQSHSFSGLTAFQAIQANLGTGERPEQVWGQIVRWNFFDVLGVEPEVGRSFRPEEDASPLKYPVVVISDTLWKHELGGDPGVVGTTLLLDGRQFTIVGVAPPGFRGTGKYVDFQLWVPLMMHPAVFDYSAHLHDRSWQLFRVVGRLRPGVSPKGAQSELQTIAARLRRAHPEVHEGHGLTLMPLRQAALGANQRTLYLQITVLLSAVVGLLFAIAATNVASLLVAKSLSRSQEMAVRQSLGSGQLRLVRQLVAEGLVISLTGALVGLGLAALLQAWVHRLELSRIPKSVLNATIDHRVLLFTLGITLVTGLLLGLAPAFQSSWKNLATTLRGRSALGGVKGSMWVLRSLIGVQVALAFLSLTGAGLFLGSLDRIRRVDPGFDARELVLLSFNLNLQGYDRASSESFYERAVAAVTALPGVRSVALSENRLLSGLGVVHSVIVEGHEPPPGQPGRLIRTNSVTPGYFETVSIPIVKGRRFNSLDRADSPRVAVVNQAMVERSWPGEDPLGKRFRLSEQPDQPIEVVGVAANAKYGTLSEEQSEYIYLPMKQSFTSSAMLVARTSGPPADWLRPVTSAVQTLDPELPLVDPTTGPRLLEDATWASRMAAILLFALGMVSLFLSGLGIYSIAFQSVERRRHEFGIRIALGAERRQVLQLVLAQTGRIVLVGLAVGLALVLALRSWFMPLIYGGWNGGWTVCTVVAVGLTVAALTAALVPAVRGMNVDPSRALSAEA